MPCLLQVASHTINWQRAVGKTVCLSVHGDKGRGHRLVIVLDASARCLPHAAYVGQPEELVDVSVLNVALTRWVGAWIAVWLHNTQGQGTLGFRVWLQCGRPVMHLLAGRHFKLHCQTLPLTCWLAGPPSSWQWGLMPGSPPPT